MSSGDKDVPPWARWSDPANVKEHLLRFKKPLLDKDAEKSEPLAFLVVRAMLLTGYEIRVTGFRDIRHDIVP